ncbi:hypothetical protein [Luteolibacter luteus]|uniref:Uncharacterized protein n=1 Tax=Luteolibacter luteus TaxID=2728835 RepID=A0A858RDC4_9BACT|nr:hypothetical protein [Luteolibacter luteus]QJE94310.1 hypothetical protein HHL09_00420 [Luteolibacter luteus]
MPSSLRYLAFLLGGAILSGWAGYSLRERKANPEAISSSGQGATRSAVRDDDRSRDAVEDFPAQIRRMMAETTKAPQHATLIPAWDKIRGFDLAQLDEAMLIAGDPLEGSGRNVVAVMLLSRWAQLDPQAALASIAEREESSVKEVVLGGVLGTWMENDPDAAYQWATANVKKSPWLRPESLRATAMLADPAEVALEKSKRMPEGVRRELIGILARSMAGSAEERERCFAMLEGMSSSERSVAAQAMMRATASSSPQAALELMESLPLEPQALAAERSASLQRFSGEKPAEAVAWLEAHPDAGNEKERGIAFNRWIERDEAAATEWLDAHENPRRVLADAVTGVNLEMLANRSGEDWRNHQGKRLRSFYDRWEKQDPDAAARWLGSAAPDVANYITREDHGDEQ